MIRIGQGYDAHRFQAGSEVILGGVSIEHDYSLAAHSDGDVLLHAICDALLGAAALGDIGKHFPDSDPAFSGVSSRLLLQSVAAKLGDLNYAVINVDATVIAEQPRIGPHVKAMRTNIAADLQIELDCVNVKGTTTEKMGFTGRGEGIAAMAACLLTRD